MEYRNFKVVYRRYASLYFIIGVDNSEVGKMCITVQPLFLESCRVPLSQNELSILEFIHNIVETFDRYFESVVSISSA